MRKLVSALGATLLLTTVATAPAQATTLEAPAAAVSSIIGTTPQDLIATIDLKVDVPARTFEFRTAVRFDDPKELVLAHWVGTEDGFQAAVKSIERLPALFHVFRLYRDHTRRVVTDNYYYTAG
jgi:hypothetical protein